MTALETALHLLLVEQTACIPVHADKRPRIAWSRYAETLPTEDECQKWFSNGSAIALLAGRIQCLDVDVKHAEGGAVLWDRLLARCEEVGLSPLVDRLLIQRTPSGGYHMVWRCDAVLRNVKLAENAKKETLLETRGTGGYFLIHPSPGYKLIQGSWEALPTLTQEERDDLLAVARSFNEHQPKEYRATVPTGTETTPGDDFDSRGDVPTLLVKHGWTKTAAAEHYWTRPGKTSGVSASWDIVPGRFWVFSSSTAFEASHVYRPWHVFAVLECDGNFQAAAKRLAELGYGAPKRSPRGAPSLHTLPSPPTFPGGSQDDSTPLPVLPPILSLDQEEASDWATPVEIVQGVLYRGAKGMIAGPSKSRKTFVLTDLAVSVAAGVNWLSIPTKQVPVLYVNLELQEFAFRDRRRAIADHKLAESVSRKYPLWSWHLRGYGVTLPLIRGRLMRHCETEGIGLIILDPTYKLNQSGQENAAEDVGRLMNEFEQVGREANATVVFCHHFAKGNAAEKSSIDRTSGSGVWARDPDAILTFSPHEDEECMIVEAHLRNFKPMVPFVVRWEYPIWVPDLNANPAAHRRVVRARSSAGPQKAAHRPRAVSDEMIEAFAREMVVEGQPRFSTKAAAVRAAAETWGVHYRTAEKYLAEWLKKGREQ